MQATAAQPPPSSWIERLHLPLSIANVSGNKDLTEAFRERPSTSRALNQ